MRWKTRKQMSRLIGRLLIFALLPPLGGAGLNMSAALALAQSATGSSSAPAMTVVQDRLYRANGTAAQGTVTVRWQGFTTADGVAVAAGELTAVLDAQGNLSIPLAPNAGASPAGGYYKATIKLNDGTTSEEVWVVPSATTATVAQIRAKTVPQSVAAQFVTLSTLQAAVAAALATPGPIGIKSPGSINATIVWTQVVNGEYNAGSFGSVQAAIAAATATGVYKVKVPEGTYKGGITIPSGITLECVSRRAVLSIGNGANTDVITIPANATNVTVRNCAIDGNAANQTTTSRGIYVGGRNANITVDNVDVSNTQGYGFLQDYADTPHGIYNTNIVVRNSRFSNTGDTSIQFKDVSGGWFEQNHISNWGAISVFGNAMGANGLNKNIHVRGNVAVAGSNSQRWFMEVGDNPPLMAIDGAEVTGNTVTGTANLSGAGLSGPFSHTVIADNVLTMPDGTGCTVGLTFELVGHDNTIASNIVTNGTLTLSSGNPNSTWPLFQSANNIIAGNVFKSTCSPGYAISDISMGNSPAYPVLDTKITNNIFDASGLTSFSQYHAVNLGSYGTSGSVDGYEIYGNTFKANSYAAGPAILLTNDGTGARLTRGSIHDNVIATNGTYCPISVFLPTPTAVNGLSIFNNDFTGSLTNGCSYGASTNVTSWGNKLGATDTAQHFTGDAFADTTGTIGAPNGIASGSTSVPPATALVGWYQASAACTTDGASLASWPDSSVSGIAAAAGTTPGTCKLSVVNGQPSVRFDGTQTGYQAANAAMIGAQTVFAVYRKTAGTTGYLMDGYTQANYGSLNATAATALTMFGTSITTPTLSGAIADDGAFHIAAYTLSSTLNTGALYFDGAQLSAGTPGGINLGGLTLGAEQSRSGGLTGDIAEVLVYNTTMTRAQVQAVDTYLATKYGLTAAGSWSINSTGANVPKVTTQQACLGTSCITAWPGGSGTGSIAGVTAGTGLTGGGTSGTVTLALTNTATTVNGVSCALGANCTVADATKVPTATAVNGHALTGNVTVTAGDVGNTTAQWNASQVNGASVPALASVLGSNSSGQLVNNARYAIRTCSVGLGDGTNAITAGTYTLGAQCRNGFGTAYTITGFSCYTDTGSTTINVTDGSSNALLTGEITGANTWAAGTQSSTTTLANGAWTTWTIVADGATKLVNCTMTGTI